MRKAASALETSRRLKKASAGIVYTGTAAGFLAGASKHNLAGPMMGMALANIAALPFSVFGEAIESRILSKCVGKPRLSRKLASGVKSPRVKILLNALGRLDKVSPTQKQALRAFLAGSKDVLQTNIAKRLLYRAVTETGNDAAAVRMWLH